MANRMPAEPFEAPSRTYPIGHLSREFGVTLRTLRYYEELGLLTPDRREGGRKYAQRDRARLAVILRGRAVGMPLDEIRTLLELHEHEGPVGQPARALATFRRRLQLLVASRKGVEQGISILQSAIEQLSQAEERAGPARSALEQAAKGEQLRGAAA